MKAEIFNDTWFINHSDERYINHILPEFIEKSGLSTLGELEYKFTPFGYTKIWLLGESPLAIHSFPEENTTYIELSSCNENKQLIFVDLMEDFIGRIEG